MTSSPAQKLWLVPFAAALLFFPSSEVRACAGPPGLRFEPPSYLDPIFVPPEYSDVWYGQQTKFRMLVTSYFEGDGYTYHSTECRGNADGAELFAAAVKAEFKDEEDQKLLLDLREELKAICGPEDDWTAYTNKIDHLRAAARVQPYLDYLKAAAFFYSFNHDQAHEGFAKIAASGTGWKAKLFFWRKTEQSWVIETSTYMTARLALIRAQDNWDGWSDPTPEQIDQDLLKESEAGFETYLERYPEGRYAASAKGLQRKIVWLQGKNDVLQNLIRTEANQIFRTVTPEVSDTSPRSEIDEFIRFFNAPVQPATDHPLVVMLNWFGDTLPSEADISALDQRSEDFKAYPGLYEFMTGWAHFKAGRHADVVAIPAPTTKPEEWNTIELSLSLLRVRSYLELGKVDAAEQAWQTIHSHHTEPHIELLYTRIAAAVKNPLQVFAPQARIQSVDLLRDMAQYGLSDDQLKAGLASPTLSPDNHLILLEELLRRQLMAQDFTGLGQTIKGEKNLGVFKGLDQLLKNRTTPAGQMALGKFIYYAFLTPDWAIHDHSGWERQGLEELQQACPGCVTQKPESLKAVPAYAYFIEAQATAAAAKQSETEAEALHYLVKCFRGSGYSEFSARCRWSNNKDVNNSKLWFERLHKLYPQSPWAAKTPYHY